MQSQYPAQFVRDMGCTEHEWLTWLQAALPDHPWQVARGQAQVPIEGGFFAPELASVAATANRADAHPPLASGLSF